MTKKEIEYLKFSLNRDVPISPDCIKEIVLQLIDENETMKAKLNGVDNEPLNVDCTLCQHFNTQKCDDLCVRYSLYCDKEPASMLARGEKKMGINKCHNENCLDTMAKMPDGFLDLTVTSPPYDNLRDYFLDKYVVWQYNISADKQQEIIKELIHYGIKPIQSP